MIQQRESGNSSLIIRQNKAIAISVAHKKFLYFRIQPI
jgi:hypothetical protein